MFKIISTSYATVEIEDEQRYRSTVFKQGDGKWKCLRCDRKRCVHAKWIAAQNPTLQELPPLTKEDLADLIDE
jgi:hypothetical protein